MCGTQSAYTMRMSREGKLYSVYKCHTGTGTGTSRITMFHPASATLEEVLSLNSSHVISGSPATRGGEILNPCAPCAADACAHMSAEVTTRVWNVSAIFSSSASW